MNPTATVGKAFNEGLRNLKENFWPFVLIVIILGILESFGKVPDFGEENDFQFWMIFPAISGGLLVFVIGFFIKPVFEFGAKLVFVRGNRDEEVDVKDIVEGFNSKELYIDIILTNLIVLVMIIVGFVCLILPGIYITCRTILSSYLVIDKGLAPKQAIKASWELTRDDWPKVILLGLTSIVMLIIGVLLLVIGIIPAFIWINGMFASFYQQILDTHDEEFLLSLDIEP